MALVTGATAMIMTTIMTRTTTAIMTITTIMTMTTITTTTTTTTTIPITITTRGSDNCSALHKAGSKTPPTRRPKSCWHHVG